MSTRNYRYQAPKKTLTPLFITLLAVSAGLSLLVLLFRYGISMHNILMFNCVLSAGAFILLVLKNGREHKEYVFLLGYSALMALLIMILGLQGNALLLIFRIPLVLATLGIFVLMILWYHKRLQLMKVVAILALVCGGLALIIFMVQFISALFLRGGAPAGYYIVMFLELLAALAFYFLLFWFSRAFLQEGSQVKAAGAASPEAQVWTCACGQENTQEAGDSTAFCQMCGRPREIPAENSVPVLEVQSGHWACQACGRENLDSALFCGRCGKDRG